MFVGIYGEQYGLVAPGRTVSGLEDEYLAASNKPKLVYVQQPVPAREARLTEMLDRVRRSGPSYHKFERAEELVGLISADLAVLLSERFDATSATDQSPGAAGEAAGTPGTDGTADTSPRDAPVRVRDDLSRLGAGNRFIGRHRELEALRKLLTDPQFTGLTPTAYLDLRRRFAAEHPDSALDAGLLPPV